MPKCRPADVMPARCRSLYGAFTIFVVVVGMAAVPFRRLSSAEIPAASTATSSSETSIPDSAIRPLEGCAWLGEDGIRAAWLGYKLVDDDMVRRLKAARINAVFLTHQMQDLLDLDSAKWDGDQLQVGHREVTLQRLIANTKRAASQGIRVFWLANYELNHTLPHLKRLGYQSAFTEGPARFIRPGPHDDAAALDRTFWLGMTGAHGELVARMSLEYPIAGALYDTEHYGGGIMYLQGSGFSDATFEKWLTSRNVDTTIEKVPAGTRYEYLKSTGHLPDYFDFLEDSAYAQGRELALRWHAINPHLISGTWPLLDSWFSQGFLRGLGGAVPSLGFSGVEYYHGSEQSKSMAEFFESRNTNLYYMAGFYPPHAYTSQQLGEHVERILGQTGNYWMLSPQEQLRQDEYLDALRTAYENSHPATDTDQPPVDLYYSVLDIDGEPFLQVETKSASLDGSPLLSLYSKLGGAPLCSRLLMNRTELGTWMARVPLLRRLTNNRYQPNGFRAGVVYEFDPIPREYQYEDTYHTKLTDGRAYGYFGTTVAWSKTVKQSAVLFDFHREYNVTRVEVAQPTKLEDRQGGPTELRLLLSRDSKDWSPAPSFRTSFPIAGRDYSEPDATKVDLQDPRHSRAWLSWVTNTGRTPARQIKIEMTRVRNNSSISLGEVVVWGIFEGEVQAALHLNGRPATVREGKRWNVPRQSE